MNIPCTDCEHYYKVSGSIVSCLGVDDLEVSFYYYSDIADMINRCPKGFRAKKLSDTETKCWREFDKVKRF